MKLTLIRHTSVDIAPGTCYGQSNVDVSENFMKEASIVKSQLQSIQFDMIFCSPLIRCIKLAEFCGYKNPVLDNRLMEINFGEWELKKWEEINDPQLDAWYKNWLDEVPTNGESFSQMVKRVTDFIIEMKNCKYQNRMSLNIAIFTHAGVIRIIESLTKQLSIKNAFEIEVNYGQIRTFKI